MSAAVVRAEATASGSVRTVWLRTVAVAALASEPAGTGGTLAKQRWIAHGSGTGWTGGRLRRTTDVDGSMYVLSAKTVSP